MSLALKNSGSNQERIEVLNQDPQVQRWLEKPSWLRTFSAHLSEECELIIKSLIAIGQEEPLLLSGDADQGQAEKLRAMLEELFPVESFYKEIGGIIGYHWTMFSFLSRGAISGTAERGCYHRPPGVDITAENDSVRSSILQGIVSLPLMGEIYPVGGAADRLNFCDPESGQPLPAARLGFNEHTLLEGLVRDVQAREYLYYKLFGEQVTTPIAMMTSSEKDNHRQILTVCEENYWFGRPQNAFRFFCQPLVPTMDKMGNWCLKGTLKLLMKPGGHGVIWKVAKDEGVFDWFESLGRKKVLIRQINNPIAGVDYGILAFCGVGFSEDKLFGFASCPRQVQSAEGVNILIERKSLNHSDYCLTNIEYCDFQKFSIEDVPVETGSAYSRFPSNTNILFADIAAVKETVKKCPIPGMLVNLKKMSFTDEAGQVVEQEVARLESTMQNIADCFEQSAELSLPLSELKLNTYLTYNHRCKTISTTKKLFQPGGSLLETPEGCFYDLLQNAHDLLSNYCNVTLPALPNAEDYIAKGPPFLFRYHPALGPLYSIIAQKIRGGKFAHNSELKLEIAEVDIANLTLYGSLHVIADQILGEETDGVLQYSESVGRCKLVNVTVENQGFDPHASSHYWKGEVSHRELCEIVIHGDGEFIAENVVLSGNMNIEVESGSRLTAYNEKGELKFQREPLSGPCRNWTYHLSDDGAILLE